jgi:hypothetical protein
LTSKKQDAGWTGKNIMPFYIPPFYKTPRSVSVVVETRKTRRKPATVVVLETEEQKSDSEDETQFGVVWEKMTEEQTNMVQNANKTTETEAPQPIVYVGEPWKDNRRPIVLITETEETERQTSNNEEENIPVIETIVSQEKVISGESSVGKSVMKQFEADIFFGQVVTAVKKTVTKKI